MDRTRLFKGQQEGTGHDRITVLYQPIHPLSSLSDSRVYSCEKEKTTLPGPLANVDERVCVATKMISISLGM
jgi:hypothetical protein